MIAVNDGVLLRNHIPRILKKHFRSKPYYVDLIDLFNEVGLFSVFIWIMVSALHIYIALTIHPDFDR